MAVAVGSYGSSSSFQFSSGVPEFYYLTCYSKVRETRDLAIGDLTYPVVDNYGETSQNMKWEPLSPWDSRDGNPLFVKKDIRYSDESKTFYSIVDNLNNVFGDYINNIGYVANSTDSLHTLVDSNLTLDSNFNIDYYVVDQTDPHYIPGAVSNNISLMNNSAGDVADSGGGLTPSGMWHTDTNFGNASTRSYYYGNDSSNTYYNGASATSGCLLSPVFNLSNSQYSYSLQFDQNYETEQPVPFDVLNETFESGANGWTTAGATNQWHLDTNDAVSATHSWYFGGGSTGTSSTYTYGSGATSGALISPILDLSDTASTYQVKFQQTFETEPSTNWTVDVFNDIVPAGDVAMSHTGKWGVDSNTAFSGSYSWEFGSNNSSYDVPLSRSSGDLTTPFLDVTDTNATYIFSFNHAIDTEPSTVETATDLFYDQFVTTADTGLTETGASLWHIGGNTYSTPSYSWSFAGIDSAGTYTYDNGTNPVSGEITSGSFDLSDTWSSYYLTYRHKYETEPVIPEIYTVFETDVESGGTAPWATTGLWNIDEYAAGQHDWWYGDTATGDYTNGKNPTDGTLESTFDLRDTNFTYGINFTHAFEIEPTTNQTVTFLSANADNLTDVSISYRVEQHGAEADPPFTNPPSPSQYFYFGDQLGTTWTYDNGAAGRVTGAITTRNSLDLTDTNYTYKLNFSQIYQTESGSNLSNKIIFQDDMESGANGWSSTGLWHLDEAYTSAGAHTDTHSWYFGNSSTASNPGTYNSGAEAAQRIDVLMDWQEQNDIDMYVTEPDSSASVTYYNDKTNNGKLNRDALPGGVPPDSDEPSNHTMPMSIDSLITQSTFGDLADEWYSVDLTGRKDGGGATSMGNYHIEARSVGSDTTDALRAVIIEDAGTAHAVKLADATYVIASGATVDIDPGNKATLGASSRSEGSLERTIDLSDTGYSGVTTITYNYYFENEGNDSTESATDFDKKYVDYYDTADSQWHNLATYDGTVNSSGWQSGTVTIPDTVNGANTKIRFRFDSVDGKKNNYHGFNIDDVKIERDTLRTADYDMRYIEYSPDSGATWTIINASGKGNSSNWTTLAGSTWDSTMSIILDSTNTGGLTDASKFRFRFDSIDGLYNNYVGWAVDDITVTGERLGRTGYDKRFVEYSTDNGASWVVLKEFTDSSSAGWNTLGGAMWDSAGNPLPGFDADLTLPDSANTANTKIRFRFDTVDGKYNNYRGWDVDDIEIVGKRSERTGYDHKYVEYQDSNAAWQVLRDYADSNFTAVDSTGTHLPVWNVQDWTGDTVQIPGGYAATKFRFRFDSGDWKYNNYEGWNLDDIKLTKVTPERTDMDKKYLEISDGSVDSNGVIWQNLATYNSNNQGWTSTAMNIVAQTAQSQFRFRFDSQDEHYNNYAGWHVDDIKLQADIKARNGFDQKYIEYTTDSGATWNSVTTFNYPNQAWTLSDVALPDAAKTDHTRVRFVFDSIDQKYNYFKGWNIDDVQVTSSKPRTGFDEKKVQYTTDGTTWYDLQNYTDFSSGGWKSESLSVPGGTSTSTTVQFRFFFDSKDEKLNNYRGWNIDNIKLTAIEPDNSSIAMDEGIVRFKPRSDTNGMYHSEQSGVSSAWVYTGATQAKTEELKNQTYYFGRTFNLSDPSAASSLAVSVNNGGSYQLIINGVEVQGGNQAFNGNISKYLKSGLNEIVIKGSNQSQPLRVKVSGMAIDNNGISIPVGIDNDKLRDLWSVSKYSPSGTTGKLRYKPRLGGALYDRQNEIATANAVLDQLTALLNAEYDLFNSYGSLIK